MKIGVRFVYDSHTFIQHPKSLDQREEQTVQHVQNILKNTQKVCFKILGVHTFNGCTGHCAFV